MITMCLVMNIFLIWSLTFFDKTVTSNPLEREQYWRHILQANEPHGLSITNGV